MISNKLEAVFKIAPSQQRRTLLLFLFGFGMSGAYVSARADADALFLARVGIAQLPAMILVGASVVAIFTLGYSKLVSRMSLRRVILGSHLLMAAATLILALIIKSESHVALVSVCLYLLAELRGALGSIQFVTLLNEMFKSSAPASVSGVAGAGSTLAGILLGGITGWLAGRFGTTSMLFVIPSLDVFAGLIALRCRRDASIDGDKSGGSDTEAIEAEEESSPEASVLEARPETSDKVVTRSPFNLLTENSLARYIAAIVCLKTVVVLLIDFQWKSAAAAKFQLEDELASFFGIFYASMFLLTGLIQLFGTSRILTRLGIQAGLAAFPGCLAVALSTVMFAPVGAVVLWQLTFARGCDVFRRGITDAAIQILYWPMKPSTRRQVIALNGGWVKPSVEALTAILLIPLAAAVSQRGQNIALILLCMLWLIVIYRGRRG